MGTLLHLEQRLQPVENQQQEWNDTGRHSYNWLETMPFA